jgi:hypothetical protein
MYDLVLFQKYDKLEQWGIRNSGILFLAEGKELPLYSEELRAIWTTSSIKSE